MPKGLWKFFGYCCRLICFFVRIPKININWRRYNHIRAAVKITVLKFYLVRCFGKRKCTFRRSEISVPIQKHLLQSIILHRLYSQKGEGFLHFDFFVDRVICLTISVANPACGVSQTNCVPIEQISKTALISMFFCYVNVVAGYDNISVFIERVVCEQIAAVGGVFMPEFQNDVGQYVQQCACQIAVVLICAAVVRNPKAWREWFFRAGEVKDVHVLFGGLLFDCHAVAESAAVLFWGVGGACEFGSCF